MLAHSSLRFRLMPEQFSSVLALTQAKLLARSPVGKQKTSPKADFLLAPVGGRVQNY
jgi:hypothetical protein